MPEFRASTLVGNASMDGNLLRTLQQQLENNEHCSLYMSAPDRSGDSKSWW
jgi:hypothetical protein